MIELIDKLLVILNRDQFNVRRKIPFTWRDAVDVFEELKKDIKLDEEGVKHEHKLDG